jgi:filamentous hemagglutinin
MALLLCIMTTLPPLSVMAGSKIVIPGFYGSARVTSNVPASNAVPKTRNGVNSVAGVYSYEDDPATPNKKVIYQQAEKIVIDWREFNIGKDAWVHFDQKGNTSWAALNRIWDVSPSLIYGKLTADGKIYLINQNGILFGPGAQVNVHTLIASSLNLSKTDFMNNALKFSRTQETGEAFYDPNNAPGTDTNPGMVTNLGTITTNDQGSVFLIGPNVENGGAIDANMGQIGLVAGYDVELAGPSSGDSTISYPGSGKGVSETRTALLVKMNQRPDGATAWNMENGFLSADQGHVGMYGGIVNQDGLIRSVTSVQRAGHVELMASQKITTGTSSWIGTPVSTSAEKFSNVDTYESTIVLSGLDDSSPNDPYVYPDTIVHGGRIDSPQGYVQLRAKDRVYLDSGSTIDVSGLWIDKSASDQVVTAAMTSVNLRDAFMQKNGVLKGQTITMGALTGSTIGDVSGSDTEGLTAVERHTKGGNVVISLVANRVGADSTATGDFIMREGATIDFSGGGFRYAAGTANTTVLISGNRIYDIGTAPTNIRYDKIINTQSVTHKRYGITDTYNGVYYGGVVPLGMWLPAHTEGSNAGSLTIGALQAVLDGTITGKVEKGMYQYLAANPEGKSGYVEPLGGELYLGNTLSTTTDNDSLDRYLGDVVITGQTGPVLTSDFTSESALSDVPVLAAGKTVISSIVLSNAGLSKIYLAANKTVKIEKDAVITLSTGKQDQTTSTFQIVARRIEHYGIVRAPGADIKLTIEGNKTTNPTDEDYVPLNERVYLADESVLDVKGERVDNRVVASAGAVRLGAHTAGGTVTIKDTTMSSDVSQQEGIAVNKGALIDVSGGWLISTAGKVSGGDAGSIELQGYSLFIDGDLRGYSLTGNKGGTVSLAAGNVSVGSSSATLPTGFAADSPWPESSRGHLVLGAGRFDNTGFTNITLKSLTGIAVDEGVRVAPSLAKLIIGGSIVTALQDNIGSSSITLSANKRFTDLASGERYDNNDPLLKLDNTLAVAKVAAGSVLETAPGGAITITGPIVDIYGTINAPAGAISVTSNNGDLTLYNGAKVLAEGYNKRSAALLKTLPLEYTPLTAGMITLDAFHTLDIGPGSVVSVAGSSPVFRNNIERDFTISSYVDAGSAGSITLKGLDVKLDGIIKGQGGMAGKQGGSLSITKTDATGVFTVSAADLLKYRNAGFDALTLASDGTLSFLDSIDIAFGRALTLNARNITASGSVSVSLRAPWIQVKYSPLVVSIDEISPSSGSSVLRLAGQYLDVTGDVVFSGFDNVLLHADCDMTFTDLKYSGKWKGSMRTAGDLTLEAARIYPTTGSVFTIETTAGRTMTGKVTILPSGASTAGSIYSAGGSLSIIAAGGIEHRGYIAAPTGRISLEATGTGLGGRVYLAEGSVTTTRGDLFVKYGTVDSSSNYAWTVTDKSNNTNTVDESAIEKSVSLKGQDVIVRDGADIDISGGGGIFGYAFEPSVSGTTNPLQMTNRWVILPDNSIVLPGIAVYLAGGNGLKAGVYTLLDAEKYAFLPGAMILTDLSMDLSGAKPTRTKEGYAVVAGYQTITGTNTQSGSMKAYSLRSASDVLAEGSFVTKSITAGDGGILKIMATNTAVINGAVRAGALSGYNAGALYVGGERVVLQALASILPSDFDFSTAISGELAGSANISQSLLSGNVFGTIGLGYNPDIVSDILEDHVAATEVTLKEGTSLEAETILLAANKKITLEKNTTVSSNPSNGALGEVSFITDQQSGEIEINSGAAISTSGDINMNTTKIHLDPKAIFTGNRLFLTGPKITLVPKTYADDYKTDKANYGTTGLFLTAEQFSGFADFAENMGFKTIGLKSKSDIVFKDSMTLSVHDTLTIDAGLIQGGATIDDNGVEHNHAVDFMASTINILNTGATPGKTTEQLNAGTGRITFTATTAADGTGGSIHVGKGTVLFDGFAQNIHDDAGVNFKADKDVFFKGVGAIKTGNADLIITASRVATSSYMDAGTYTAAEFLVDAGIGRVSMVRATGGDTGTDSAPGSLELKGDSIDVSTLIETPAGQLKLTAANNIDINAGGEIRAQGTEYAPGGDVILTSTGGGKIDIKETQDALGNAIASIDVSGGSQGDAGSIKLYAPSGGVSLAGKIKGQAGKKSDGSYGAGGSFDITTNTLAPDASMGFSVLNAKLREGGFNETLNIRSRTGDITIAGTGNESVKARNVKITTDGGDLTLSGAIDASQTSDDAGSVELNAWSNLTLSGAIDAHSSGGSGGEVSLNAGHIDAATGWLGSDSLKTGTGTGSLTMNTGSLVNVDGNAAGKGGKVHFRAYRADTASNIDLNGGTITGASDITAETAQAYRWTGASNNVGATTNYSFAAPASVNSALTIVNGVQGSAASLRKLSGIEIRSDGDLTFGTDWILSAVRPGSQPGVLTLRAVGNLNINANIIDSPTASSSLYSIGYMANSWGANLIAGADTTSAALMTIKPAGTQGATTGTLTIATGKAVYTENAPIRFASGGDTVINVGKSNNYMIASSMQYTLASYGGTIKGDVAGDLNIQGGVIQTAVGDIDIRAGGNLVLGSATSGGKVYDGTIRTMGEHGVGSGVNDFQTYANGGSINLSVGGNVSGQLSSYWLQAKMDSANSGHYWVIPLYGQALSRVTEGIAALSGGSVYVKAGGSVGEIQTGAFGQGDLRVYALGDLKGRFRIKNGISELSAAGNFGSSDAKPIIEMSAAQVAVAAQGSLYTGGILDPALVKNSTNSFWDNQYTINSSVKLKAVTGDVNVNSFNPNAYDLYAGSKWGYNYLPATVKIEAGRDINLSAFTLMPSPTGQLNMSAGRDLNAGAGEIVVSDADSSGVPHTVYGSSWLVDAAYPQPNLKDDHGTVADDSGSSHPLHYGDEDAVSISAGRDINSMKITLPKKASIYAGRDIVSLDYTGMNIADDDLTGIYAGRDIMYTYAADTGTIAKKMEQKGPGYFAVGAGGSIDLGNTKGIITTGNAGVATLGPQGSSLIVAAGIDRELKPKETIEFFDRLRAAGDEYSTLLAAGDTTVARDKVEEARTQIIAPFIPSINSTANISMTSSQISTQAGGDLFVFAGGRIDVGRTAIGATKTATESAATDKNTGIFTALGGAINIFVRGDLNVNESRVMSFMGGDITVWSDEGNVNAGRGSRTAVSAMAPRSYVNKDGVVVTVFQIPAVGSGIRAVTYDPDGPGPLVAPEAGMLHIVAPTGAIDAGEAGMGGRSAMIGASQVLNTQNMSFSQGAVGVPAQTQSVNMGALTGNSVAGKEAMSTGVESLARMDTKNTDTTNPIEEMLKRLDVKVMSYELSLGPQTEEEKREK